MSKYKVSVEDKQIIPDIIVELSKEKLSDKNIYRVLKRHPKADGSLFTKPQIYNEFTILEDTGEISLSEEEAKTFKKNIQMKKVRTISGVTPVTVLTKPFPCPGKCVFCPSDVRMPKSYLSDEPGAQRALMNKFDPYLQTFNRLVAFKNMGHPTDKVEILVLGGTWSSYPEQYQIWFVKRCFDALNDFDPNDIPQMITPEIDQPFEESLLEEIDGANIERPYNKVISRAIAPKVTEAQKESATWDELFEVHKANVNAKTKCVGLVIETRPDEINKEEVLKIRKLGATRVQIGIQSLNDEVLLKNKRGHDVAKTSEAFLLLRQAGFKILAHWMPNLYGSTPQEDIKDYSRVFDIPDFRPDELKIYPCSLISSAELMKFYNDGSWKPYSQDELADVLIEAFEKTPRYCRLTRVIRDIPSTDIVVGNKKTNFRQIAEQKAAEQNIRMKDIRSREIRNTDENVEDLKIVDTVYDTLGSEEHFIEFVTESDKIAGFIRLSLPTKPSFIDELCESAIIREVHVYGKSINVGKTSKSGMQHKGLGKSLISEAEKVAKEADFKSISVISAIGTQKYYQKLGYELQDLYQIKHF